VARYRHQAYAWLGVEKVELAVLAELLLRGPQTVGLLRGRAARMEPIADLGALQPHLDSLRRKGLIVLLSPEGRGCAVTHALYPPTELEAIRARFASGTAATWEERPSGGMTQAAASPMSSASHSKGIPATATTAREELDSLRREVDELRRELGTLRSAVSELRTLWSEASSRAEPPTGTMPDL
jgi:uncharacterized protein YceH (UPF0502 family)